MVANHLGGQRESHDALHASWEESRRKAASVVTYMGSPMAVSTVRRVLPRRLRSQESDLYLEKSVAEPLATHKESTTARKRLVRNV